MATTYELYTNENGTPKAVDGKAPAIIERVEVLETDVTGLKATLGGKLDALTEGLAGKEDKGVCLPLTGGQLTGSVIFKGMSAGESHAPIYTTDPAKELVLVAGNADFSKGGGALTLYGRDHEIQGGWSLLARSRDDDLITLQGNPITRKLLWGGQIVDPIVQEYALESSGFIKYASGYQVVWGTGSVENGDYQPVTLTTPFSSVYYVVVANCFESYGSWSTQDRTTTEFLGTFEGSPVGNIMYVAYGRWK